MTFAVPRIAERARWGVCLLARIEEVPVEDGRPTAFEDKVPLNLRLQRAPSVKTHRTPSKQTFQLVGLLVSGVLLLAVSRRGGRFAVPAAISLAAGSVAAVAAALVAKRRHGARDAAIDRQVEQSFPASDPPAV
jgi:hypothetical protein